MSDHTQYTKRCSFRADVLSPESWVPAVSSDLFIFIQCFSLYSVSPVQTRFMNMNRNSWATQALISCSEKCQNTIDNTIDMFTCTKSVTLQESNWSFLMSGTECWTDISSDYLLSSWTMLIADKSCWSVVNERLFADFTSRKMCSSPERRICIWQKETMLRSAWDAAALREV